MGISALLVLASGCTGSDDEAEPIPVFVPPALEALAALGPGEGSLNLLARPGYADTAWVEPFQRDTGCLATVTTYESDGQLENGLSAGGFDLVAAPGYNALGLVGSGAAAPLNLDLVPSFAGVATDLKGQRWNTWNGITYGVPQGRAASLVTWRTDIVTTATLDTLFAASSENPVALPGSPVTLAAAALSQDVEDPYALDGAQLAAAEQLVSDADPDLLWETESEAYDALANGDVAIALVPQPLVDRLVAAGVPVASASAGETAGNSDSWMLLADAAHPNCAYRWLDYTVRGGVQAQSSATTGQAPANVEACASVADLCTRTHAQDPAFWTDVAMATTPLGDCLDGRDDIACTDAEDWAAAWQRITDPSASASGSASPS